MPTKDVLLGRHVASLLEDAEFRSALLAAVGDWKKVTNAIEAVPTHEGRMYAARYFESMNLNGVRGAADNALVDTVLQLVEATCGMSTITIETEAENAE